MEPVTLISTALAAGTSTGALDALKDDAKEKVKAAYRKLHGLVKKRVSGRPHGELALAEYESAPQKWEGLLTAELTEAGAAQDDDLVAAVTDRLDREVQTLAVPLRDTARRGRHGHPVTRLQRSGKSDRHDFILVAAGQPGKIFTVPTGGRVFDLY